MWVTPHCNLQLILSKTIKIGDTKYDIQGRFTHKPVRACDHGASSTLVGGKGGSGPSSLHPMLEGSK